MYTGDNRKQICRRLDRAGGDRCRPHIRVFSSTW